MFWIIPKNSRMKKSDIETFLFLMNFLNTPKKSLWFFFLTQKLGE